MNKIIPIDYQIARAEDIWQHLIVEDKPAVLLTDQVGYGKTFEYLFFIQRLVNSGYFKNATVPYPVMIVTKASVVEQTARVVKDFNLQKVVRLVTNYDQLRSDFGEHFIEGKWEIVGGQEVFTYNWYTPMVPMLVLCDESHSLKNPDAQQTKIVQALINLVGSKEFADSGQKCKFIFSSASPATRLSELKYFMTATRIPMKYGWAEETPCNALHWQELAWSLAGPRTSIEDHSPASMKRFREHFKDYIISTKYSEVVASFKKLGRSLHKAKNGTLCIPFRTEAQRAFYTAAYERYLLELSKIDKNEPGGIAAIWVAIGKFRQAAEECRAPDLAELMYQSYLDGKAPVCAVNYKKTIALAIKYLVETKGIPREKISTIWGGLVNPDEDFSDENLELGPQSRKARQKNIDRFQKDASDFCFFTFKAGGAGLSLHQATPEMKVRVTFASPTYSAIEIVQGLGRVPRITSWSDTEQNIIFYLGTIEEQVAKKMDVKLRSIREVVAANETWAEELVPDNDRLRELIKSLKVESDTDSDEIANCYLGEDEESE